MAAERPDFYSLIAANRRRTWFLMTAFFLLLAFVGVAASYAIGGGIVMVVIALVLSAAMTFGSYFQSHTIALRSTRAVPADPGEFARLINLVQEVSLAAGITPPKVYVVHDVSPNAFATGRNQETATVAVTTGLLDKLNRAELEGVVAHEIAHIRNNDILVMTVAVATAGSIAIISDLFWRMLYFGMLGGGGASRRRSNDGQGGGANVVALVGFVIVLVVAPLAAALLRAAISRKRESLADATAVEFTRYPSGLRQALEKLDADITVVKRTSHATSHLWIESPDDHETKARGRRFNDLFNTHPPLKERIDLLRAMEGLPPYEGPDPVVAESLRTYQSERSAVAAAGAPAAAAGLVGSEAIAASTIDVEAVFGGMGEVAADDDDPTHARAGWYADPGGDPARLRYWNGREWTDHWHEIPDQNRPTPPGSRPRRRTNRRSGRPLPPR